MQGFSLRAGALVTILVVLVASIRADYMEDIESFLADISQKASIAQEQKQGAVTGEDGWLFLTAELHAVSAGPFWGENAKAVSRASNPKYTDPLDPIVDFHHQLAGAGIELILVPVPAKSTVYPEKLSGTFRANADGRLPYLAIHHQEFYEILRNKGVNVLDVTSALIDHRNDDEGLTFCKTDAHWSGRACAFTAKLIVDQIRDRDWFDTLSKNQYDTTLREVEITGDMLRMVSEEYHTKEILPLTFVGVRNGDMLIPVETDRDSPVILMGDSHTLVFHDPSLHAKGAGLADHLALQLGFPVDLVGVRGSGASGTRINLLRRRDDLQGKKLIIWCISMREFTESFQGWKKVPVIGNTR